MANKKISEMAKITNSDNVKDNYFMPIVLQEGETLSNRAVTIEVLRGALSKGGSEYVELTSKDGTKFRVTLNNEGEFVVYPAIVYTASNPDPTDSGSFKGLIINSMYGAGSTNQNNTPCSHHYIELYNKSQYDLNLKGLYLSFKGATGNWTSLALEGYIPSQHSFLVRCNRVSDPIQLTTRMKIRNYDMEWPVDLPENGFSAYLSVGEPSNAYTNPWNHDGANNKAPGYIDILAAGGLTTDYRVEAFEYRYGQYMSKDIGIRRLDFAESIADFAFKDQPENNQTAVKALDYRTCDVDTYRPRCLKDGKWDVYFDKLKLKTNVPNLINICYGKDGETTRTFTYQTPVMDEGYVRYRKEGESKWHTIETSRDIVSHYDTEATIHRAIIRNLEPGTYEYQAGTEGMWSDVATFQVKTYGTGSKMRILWTTDQQSWTTEQYQAWKVLYQNIVDYEPEGWDWHLNTGDISQNANRSFEWRAYFQYSLESTRNCCHMITCG